MPELHLQKGLVLVLYTRSIMEPPPGPDKFRLHAAACTADAQSLVNDCNNLITLFTSNSGLRQQATALNGASDAQIQAAIAANPTARPSPA